MFAWQDSRTFLLQNHPNVTFVIQDEHRLTTNEKFNTVMNLLKHAELMRQILVFSNLLAFSITIDHSMSR
jgi:hypothetical protein